MSGANVRSPTPHLDDRTIWDGVADDRLVVKACATCDRIQHPPTPMCRDCGGVSWVARQLSGRGVVHSWIVSRHPSKLKDPARIVVLVELEEGVRMVSNLCDIDIEAVRNEMPVDVTFRTVDGVRLPQFVARSL